MKKRTFKIIGLALAIILFAFPFALAGCSNGRDSLYDRINELEQELEELGEETSQEREALLAQITALASQVTALQAELATQVVQVAALQNELQETQEALAALRLELGVAQGAIDTLEARVDELEEKLAASLIAQGNLQQQINTLQNSVSELEERVAYLEGRISNRVFIYLTEGTLPTLNAFLHVLSHNYPSFMLFGRKDTFNHEMLPSHVTMVREPGIPGTPESEIRIPEDIIAMRDLVKELEEEFNQPYFHFFAECINALTPFYIMERANIPRERFQITLLSDGANHPSIFLQLPPFWAPPGFSDGDLLFSGPNGLDNWRHFIDSFNNYWLPLFASDEGLAFEHYRRFRPNWAYMWAAALQPNVDFWISFPGWFFMQDVHPAILGDLIHATLVGRKAYDQLEGLERHRRDIFFEATLNNPNFAIEGVGSLRTMLEDYFTQDKPVMIVSGTHGGTVSGAGGNVAHFITALEEIIEEFGDDYVLMYKPHPSWVISHPGNAPLLAFLEEHNIRILPPRLPMEVIMWAFPDVQVGGFNSTLYISARASQVRFFIGGLGAGMVNFLYESGAFPLATGVRFGV